MTEPATAARVHPGFWRWIVAGLVLLVVAAVLTPSHDASHHANPARSVTGDRDCVTNHAGIIYYTGLLGTAFELNDACVIPPNALPVGK